jgi:hypothetical protein
MRVEDTGAKAIFKKALRPAAIVTMLAAAIAIPTWLYHARGRKLPIAVVLTAKRYVIGPGEALTIRSRLLPKGASVERYWRGPGVVSGSGKAIRWKAPAEPGLYTISLRVRRSASYAEDAISIRVADRPFAKLPRPEVATAPELPKWPACPQPDGMGSPTKITLLVPPCAGQRLLVAVPSKPVPWMYLSGHSARARFGSHAELRLPKTISKDEPVELFVVQANESQHCLQTTRQPIAVERCEPEQATTRPASRPSPSSQPSSQPSSRPSARPNGSTAPLIAEFQWELISRSGFRLRARPQHEAHPAVRYRWQLDPKTTRETKLPLLAHEFKTESRYHVVKLTVVAGGKKAHTARLLVDRTIIE